MPFLGLLQFIAGLAAVLTGSRKLNYFQFVCPDYRGRGEFILPFITSRPEANVRPEWPA